MSAPLDIPAKNCVTHTDALEERTPKNGSTVEDYWGDEIRKNSLHGKVQIDSEDESISDSSEEPKQRRKINLSSDQSSNSSKPSTNENKKKVSRNCLKRSQKSDKKILLSDSESDLEEPSNSSRHLNTIKNTLDSSNKNSTLSSTSSFSGNIPQTSQQVKTSNGIAASENKKNKPWQTKSKYSLENDIAISNRFHEVGLGQFMTDATQDVAIRPYQPKLCRLWLESSNTTEKNQILDYCSSVQKMKHASGICCSRYLETREQFYVCWRKGPAAVVGHFSHQGHYKAVVQCSVDDARGEKSCPLIGSTDEKKKAENLEEFLREAFDPPLRRTSNHLRVEKSKRTMEADEDYANQTNTKYQDFEKVWPKFSRRMTHIADCAGCHELVFSKPSNIETYFKTLVPYFAACMKRSSTSTIEQILIAPETGTVRKYVSNPLQSVSHGKWMDVQPEGYEREFQMSRQRNKLWKKNQMVESRGHLFPEKEEHQIFEELREAIMSNESMVVDVRRVADEEEREHRKQSGKKRTREESVEEIPKKAKQTEATSKPTVNTTKKDASPKKRLAEKTPQKEDIKESFNPTTSKTFCLISGTDYDRDVYQKTLENFKNGSNLFGETFQPIEESEMSKFRLDYIKPRRAEFFGGKFKKTRFIQSGDIGIIEANESTYDGKSFPAFCGKKKYPVKFVDLHLRMVGFLINGEPFVMKWHPNDDVSSYFLSDDQVNSKTQQMDAGIVAALDDGPLVNGEEAKQKEVKCEDSD